MSLKTVYKTNEFSRAHILKSRLESEGIRAYVINQNAKETGMALLNTGISLMVGTQDWEAAHEILSEYEDLRSAEEDHSHCPTCGSTDLKVRFNGGPLKVVRLLLLFGLGLLFPFDTRLNYQCRNCGHEFTR